MARRLMRNGHQIVGYDPYRDAVDRLAADGATPVYSPEALVQALETPRVLWLMVPAAVVDSAVRDLLPLLAAGDIVVDGGNSHYADDIRRARDLAVHGIGYLDVGTSGGVWGLERGYCLMVGGTRADFLRVEPILAALAPLKDSVVPTSGRPEGSGTADRGYLHCGPAGAGHFVKMVHNGIEYGLMAAYAEGLNILRHADIGTNRRENDAETTPLQHPEHYQFDFDIGEITELWRRGSVVSSWLLDLTASALAASPSLDEYAGRVSDSGEGRWTIKAAIDEAVPAPVLTAALYERFSSRGQAEFGNRVLSAMRAAFGGHVEKT